MGLYGVTANDDPYPGRPFAETLRSLRERFPDGDLRCEPVGGDVFISLPLRNGEIFRAGLTWRQAKYLACTRLTGDDLKDGHVPADWPK